MLTRRTFALTTVAALAAPAIARAEFQLDPKFAPQSVRIKKGIAPGQLLILPRSHFLYWVTGEREARRYGIGVGKAGLEFTGTAQIGAKKEWLATTMCNRVVPVIRWAPARFTCFRTDATPTSASTARHNRRRSVDRSRTAASG